MCPQGMLGKHFEKLMQCDPRLNFLSQEPEILLESPYFESKVPIYDEPDVSSHSKREEGPVSFDLQHAASPSGVQSSSSNFEQDFFNPSTGSGKILNLKLRFMKKMMHIKRINHVLQSAFDVPKAFLHVVISSSNNNMFLLRNISHKAIISDLGHLFCLLSTIRIFFWMTLINYNLQIGCFQSIICYGSWIFSLSLYTATSNLREEIFSKKKKKKRLGEQ